MGLSIILQSLGINQKEIEFFIKNKNKEIPFDGFLANISVAQFESDFAKIIPQQISGEAFIEKYGTTTDPLSTIQKNEIYNIYNCTKHPIYENERIHRFRDLLKQKPLDKSTIGALMLDSHQGYVDCGLSCDEADYIISLAKKYIGKRKVYGARITGGGSGGTVCILAEDVDIANQIQKEYCEKYPHKTSVFSKSGNGAYFLN